MHALGVVDASGNLSDVGALAVVYALVAVGFHGNLYASDVLDALVTLDLLWAVSAPRVLDGPRIKCPRSLHAELRPNA